ncbi:alpha/beta hydrolase [Candidatus Sumerlaeota bacterium]|nr:alpha/beta hydrolase [Candidatus Sumerlaeota bacterium]
MTEPAPTVDSASPEAVVFLHGVWRSARSMRRLERTLRGEGYAVHSETYPSLRQDIVANGRWLAERLEAINAPRIHFVTHSMGALVLRQCLSEREEPRLGRVVMIAPPSRGARLADVYSRIPLFPLIMGKGALQLRTGEEGLGASLPPPPCEFAIIAGGRGHPRGWHPQVPGDDDGTVGVTEAYLPGATAFITVPAGHTFIMNNPRTIEATAEFLRTGQISVDETPLPSDEGVDEQTQ